MSSANLKLSSLLASTRLWDLPSSEALDFIPPTSNNNKNKNNNSLSILPINSITTMTNITPYSILISDLTREVSRSQPHDPLQFCTNWFLARLENERSINLATNSNNNNNTTGGEEVHMSDSTPPMSSRSLLNDTPKGYTFGGPQQSSSSSGGDGMEVEGSPFSTASPFASSNSNAGSSVQDRESTLSPRRKSIAPPSLSANSLPPPSTSTTTNHSADSDEEVSDPRDDPNYNPNGPTSGIPLGYNLGRRSSVSAESLDPNAPSSLLPKTVIPKTPSQRARIESSISNNLLFRNLDEDQYKDVLNAMKEVAVTKGTKVIVQGAVGDFFYVVEAGAFEVWVRAPPTHTYTGPGISTSTPGIEKQVASYGPGGSFGELALMYNAPRAATVVATTEATMWALDRVTFRSILMEHTSRKRKMYESFLAEVPILESLNTKERAKIADALEEKVYEEGDRVVVEGDIGKNFYIIESGQAEVSRKKEDGEEVLGTLSKGDYFGELALLNSAPRAATVRAMAGHGRLRVATLGEKAFTRLLGPVIDILQRKAQHAYGGAVASAKENEV